MRDKNRHKECRKSSSNKNFGTIRERQRLSTMKIRECFEIMKIVCCSSPFGLRRGRPPPSTVRINMCDRSEKVEATPSGPAQGYQGQKRCHNGHNNSDKKQEILREKLKDSRNGTLGVISRYVGR